MSKHFPRLFALINVVILNQYELIVFDDRYVYSKHWSTENVRTFLLLRELK